MMDKTWRWSTWAFRLVVWTVLFLAHFTPPSFAAEAPPNIVLIVIDDLGWADLGSYGSRFFQTPHLDRLAREGMRFTHAYAACPVCSPTRAAIMTGKYPARLHLTDWIPGRGDGPTQRLLSAPFRQELPLGETTIAEVFHQAGYATASIGKWHLGGEGFEPTRQGFDVNIGGNQSGSVRSYFAPFVRQPQGLPGLKDAPDGEFLTVRLTLEAENFIEQNKDRPFFLYFPHYAVHTPIEAPGWRANVAVAPAQAGVQSNLVYAAMVNFMDQSVGRILAKLELLKLTDNTIVVFTSDNGGLATAEGASTPPTSNAPLREGKGYLYEGGIRVPLIVKWPGHVAAGSTSDTPAASYDLLPTLAAACDVPLKARLDGVSLLPVLTRSGTVAREALYWHYPHYSPQGGKPGGTIRQGDFKLIEFYEKNRRELYDVVNDVSESTNLIEKEPLRAQQLADKLSAWREAIGAQETQPNPAFAPDTQAADGTITLHAKTADIHGVMIRFEPLPHKNTIGFWVRLDDYVSWDFDVKQPGEFRLGFVQGCGKGSGGSVVDFTVADQTLTATVEETGGFQAFVARPVGDLKLAAGRYTLTVKPRTKPGAAVMDLRQVKFIPLAPQSKSGH